MNHNVQNKFAFPCCSVGKPALTRPFVMTISMVYQFWTTGRGNIAIVSWIFMIITMTFRLGHLGWHPIQPGKLQLINSNLTMEELIYISHSTYLIKWKIFEWNYHEKIRYLFVFSLKFCSLGERSVDTADNSCKQWPCLREGGTVGQTINTKGWNIHLLIKIYGGRQTNTTYLYCL